MKKTKKISIPNDVTLIYCNKKNLLTFVGPKGKSSVKVVLKVVINSDKRQILVTSIPLKPLPRNKLKKIFSVQGLTVSLIKSKILEVKLSFYVKLKLVGVGYRVLLDDTLKTCSNFKLRLGFSHMIYYNLPVGVSISCKKNTKVTLRGNTTLESLTQTSAKIRNCRKPEPYKGKGVLRSNENIKLKIGKRV